jgi:hypothetical protein|tara:strand:- start:186 stop:344 length:159 start_codon:yes stop_codon:yes gene_type:complete
MNKKEKYDGRSRPTNQVYEKRWNEIFGEKKNKELAESYKQSKINKEERKERK